jgi:hypothetical protein
MSQLGIVSLLLTFSSLFMITYVSVSNYLAVKKLRRKI